MKIKVMFTIVLWTSPLLEAQLLQVVVCLLTVVHRSLSM